MPDFLILGAMKAGTTTLYGYLARHPGIFLSNPKEPQFFSREAVFGRGLEWYRGLFLGAAPDQLCGEASTCYSRWPHFGDVAGRIAAHLPDVKLIYQVRHPVDRAYSHYVHLMQRRLVRRTEPLIDFATALESIPEILDSSRYAMQLRQYLEHFDQKQILVTTLDDVRARPAETLARVQKFLGIETIDLLADGPLEENQWENRLERGLVRARRTQIRHAPRVAASARLLPPALRRRLASWARHPRLWRWVVAGQLERDRRALEPLAPESRAHLTQALTPSVRELEAITGSSFQAWFDAGKSR